MAANPPKVYCESCCFIDLAKKQHGVTTDPARDRHLWFAEQILRAGRAGDLQVYTLTLTTVECLHIDRQYTPEIQRIFKTLLSGASGIIPIQPDPFVVERARDLRWVHNLTLKPFDSLHVAAALEVGCTEFITTDGGILKRFDQLNSASLGLRAIMAADTRMLPEGYKQIGAPGILPKKV
jgi:predicted nucleic acid-binding protein